MSGRERQLWTEFVRKREERKDEKQARKRRAKKPEPTPAELEQALNDLGAEAEQRTAASSTAPAGGTRTPGAGPSGGWRRSPCSPTPFGTRAGAGCENGCQSV